jgi:phosphopantetheinyl transferase (holo-ACP synthase)
MPAAREVHGGCLAPAGHCGIDTVEITESNVAETLPRISAAFLHAEPRTAATVLDARRARCRFAAKEACVAFRAKRRSVRSALKIFDRATTMAPRVVCGPRGGAGRHRMASIHVSLTHGVRVGGAGRARHRQGALRTMLYRFLPFRRAVVLRISAA